MDDELDTLEHIGTPRHSGRYPWGSGSDPYQSGPGDFLQSIDIMAKKSGMTQGEIAKYFGLSGAELIAYKSIAKNEKRAADISLVRRLREDKQVSLTAIANKTGLSEATVRNYLKPGAEESAKINNTVAETLKAAVDKNGFIDVGEGVPQHLGISPERMKVALTTLKAEGYKVYYDKVRQLGTGNETSIKALCPPGTDWKDDFHPNLNKIQLPLAHSPDQGRTFDLRVPPQSMDGSRIGVRYGSEGGADKDGVIEIRRGVDDISLQNSNYAQVRVLVDGTHYLKGMAVYSDNLPKGKDIVFNTNKESTGNDHDAMKPVKSDPRGLNPFGSSISNQLYYIDKNGERKLSPMNIVNDEGDWAGWSKTVSSQMLSKQDPKMAKEQLEHTYGLAKVELDLINALTNPTVKKQLLDEFASNADAKAVHLKAASMPRSSNHVILPLPSIKENQIYAPNYKQGEQIALIRHPHGGIFEIPVLTVNNKNAEGKNIITPASRDAVGINPKTAQQLSGADFDGDSVLIIPMSARNIKHSAPLEQLKNFDPKREYPGYPGMTVLEGKAKQTEMGKISNLITDMTIKGAVDSEIARAVKHSMVVIDAEKHELNWKQSAKDMRITELKKEYQGKANAGASTLISKASSDLRVPDRKARLASEGGPINIKTGELEYTPTGAGYTKTTINPKTGAVTEKWVDKVIKTSPMAETRDAHTLSSGQVIEKVYADYANNMKSLANQARLEAHNTPPLKHSPSASKIYAPEVQRLRDGLREAQKNAPLERRAQILANTQLAQIREANPDRDKDDLKKEGFRLLEDARQKVGANKPLITFTGREWEAVQAGAIPNSVLADILKSADKKQVRELATPRAAKTVTSSVASRMKAMKSMDYTLAEIAQALGVSTTTVGKVLNG